MKSLFITGSGTDIGKTYILSALLREIKALRPLTALKPLISGFDGSVNSDTHLLLQANGLDVNEETINQISPYRFKAPLSPDQAALLESTLFNYDDLIYFCHQKLQDTSKTWLIEGVGGVMAPLSEDKTMLDWIDDMALDVLFIAGSYLGAMSHALSGVLALQSRGIEVKAMVVNQSISCVDLEQTANSLRSFVGTIPVVVWPRDQDVIPWTLRELL